MLGLGLGLGLKPGTGRVQLRLQGLPLPLKHRCLRGSGVIFGIGKKEPQRLKQLVGRRRLLQVSPLCLSWVCGPEGYGQFSLEASRLRIDES